MKKEGKKNVKDDRKESDMKINEMLFEVTQLRWSLKGGGELVYHACMRTGQLLISSYQFAHHPCSGIWIQVGNTGMQR